MWKEKQYTVLMENTFWKKSPHSNSILDPCNDIILRHKPQQNKRNVNLIEPRNRLTVAASPTGIVGTTKKAQL